jgi:hypothetical protein
MARRGKARHGRHGEGMTKISDDQLGELALRLLDKQLAEYIDAHPAATPEEICAAFGIPFDRVIWNGILDRNPDALRLVQSDPNPVTRKKWGYKHDG